MHLTIIGGGRAAWAFGASWRRADWVVDRVELRATSRSNVPELLSSRRATMDEPLASDLVLVAVPDDALPDVCRNASRRAEPDTWLFHASGSHDSSLFEGSERAFSLHPLRALPPAGEGEGLADALLVFEGPSAGEVVAREIARRFGARFATIPRARKPLYHAAAVLAANLVAALLDTASDLMIDSGLGSNDVDEELARLSRSAISNWAQREGVERFTGPIARGDAALVERHLALLAGHGEAERVYRATGLALCKRLLRIRPEDQALRRIEGLLSGSPVS